MAAKTFNIDFMAKRRSAALASAILVMLSVISLLVKQVNLAWILPAEHSLK